MSKKNTEVGTIETVKKNINWQEIEVPGSLKAMQDGIRWREKLDYGRTISFFIYFWVTCQFILQAFEQVAWVLAFGITYSLFIGIKAGGNEVSDGAEEFSFSLATPRSERFKTKFIFGLIPLVIMLVLSLLTIRFNLSQYFWGLFVETGFNAPYIKGNKESLFLYGLGLLIPLTLYITVFTMTIISWGPSWIPGAIFKALFITAISVLGVAFLHHNLDTISGTSLAFILLIIVSVVSLHRSFNIYIFKEGHSVPRTGSSRGGNGSMLGIIIAVIVLFLLFIFMSKVSSDDTQIEEYNNASEIIRSIEHNASDIEDSTKIITSEED
jgi:hypothetical protein